MRWLIAAMVLVVGCGGRSALEDQPGEPEAIPCDELVPEDEDSVIPSTRMAWEPRLALADAYSIHLLMALSDDDIYEPDAVGGLASSVFQPWNAWPVKPTSEVVVPGGAALNTALSVDGAFIYSQHAGALPGIKLVTSDSEQLLAADLGTPQFLVREGDARLAGYSVEQEPSSPGGEGDPPLSARHTLVVHRARPGHTDSWTDIACGRSPWSLSAAAVAHSGRFWLATADAVGSCATEAHAVSVMEIGLSGAPTNLFRRVFSEAVAQVALVPHGDGAWLVVAAGMEFHVDRIAADGEPSFSTTTFPIPAVPSLVRLSATSLGDRLALCVHGASYGYADWKPSVYLVDDQVHELDAAGFSLRGFRCLGSPSGDQLLVAAVWPVDEANAQNILLRRYTCH